ncbi:hypothetical protein AB4356_19845, partial [Vibrio lentus]
MDNNLLQFSDWLFDKYEIKTTITNDIEKIDFGKFNIVTDGNELEINSHDTISPFMAKESYDDIYGKLVELGIHKKIRSSALRFSEKTIHYLKEMEKMNSIYLHKDISSVDLST